MSDTTVIVAGKDELLRLTNDAWSSLVAATELLTQEQWTGPTDAAGWTVKDHVAHVTAWDVAAIALLERHVPMQTTTRVSDAAWASGSFDIINEEIRQQHLNVSVEAIKAQRTTVFNQLVKILEGYSEDELAAPKVIAGMSRGEQPLKDEFYAYFAKHYEEHLGYIQGILGKNES
jgi:hypothetical protein